MNATISDVFQGALKEIPAKELKIFFNELRDNEYATLTGTPDSELTKVKHRVMIIDELEALFKTARQQSPTHIDSNE